MRRLSIPRLVPALLCSVALLGCEGASEPEFEASAPQILDLQAANVQKDNPFLGSWRLTSAVVGSDELFDRKDGMYIVTYRSDGTHSVSVSGDVAGLVCGGPPSCEWDGEYWYTGTTITHDEPNHPDPDEAGEDTGYYAFCGGKWFYLDSAGDDEGVRLTYQRTGGGR